MVRRIAPALPASPAILLHSRYTGSIAQAGGAVSQWSDLSGHGKHWTQANASLQPAYADGLITFDGSGDHLEGPIVLPGAGAGVDFALAFCCTPATVAGTRGAFNQYRGTANPDGRGQILIPNAAAWRWSTNYTGGNVTLDGGTAGAGTTQTIGARRSGSTVTLTVDGTDVDTDTNAAAYLQQTATIGDRLAGESGIPFQGSFRGLVYYGSALSSSDRATVRAWLASTPQAYTLAYADGDITADAYWFPLTLALPAASALAAGQSITITRTDTPNAISTSPHACTIQAAGADAIDGESSLALSDGQGVALVSDGVDSWRIAAVVVESIAIDLSAGISPSAVASAVGSILLPTSVAASSGPAASAVAGVDLHAALVAALTGHAIAVDGVTLDLDTLLRTGGVNRDAVKLIRVLAESLSAPSFTDESIL